MPIQEMRKMSGTHKREQKTQIAIVLTDGHSNVDPARTVPEAKLAHNDGIEIIVIGYITGLRVILWWWVNHILLGDES